MKQYLFLLILLLSISAYGKQNSDKKESRISIGINFSPDYCYRKLAKDDKNLSQTNWENYKRMLDSMHVPKFSYTTGINFRFQLNKRVSIETGLQYSNKGYKSIPMPTIYNWDQPNISIIATTILNYHYYSLPLKLNYALPMKKIHVLGTCGLTLDYLQKVSGKVIPEHPSDTIKARTNVSVYPYNKINISAIISTGLKYHYNKKISFQTEPTFRYSLLSFDSRSSQMTHLWSLGLNLCSYIRL